MFLNIFQGLQVLVKHFNSDFFYKNIVFKEYFSNKIIIVFRAGTRLQQYYLSSISLNFFNDGKDSILNIFQGLQSYWIFFIILSFSRTKRIEDLKKKERIVILKNIFAGRKSIRVLRKKWKNIVFKESQGSQFFGVHFLQIFLQGPQEQWNS